VGLAILAINTWCPSAASARVRSPGVRPDASVSLTGPPAPDRLIPTANARPPSHSTID
jgi:hypothetical protein